MHTRVAYAGMREYTVLLPHTLLLFSFLFTFFRFACHFGLKIVNLVVYSRCELYVLLLVVLERSCCHDIETIDRSY